MLEHLFLGIFFYLIYSSFGIVGLALLSAIPAIRKNLSLAWLISKPIGLIIIAYPIWLLSSMKLDLIKYSNFYLVLFLTVMPILISLFFLVTRMKLKKYFLTFFSLTKQGKIGISDLVNPIKYQQNRKILKKLTKNKKKALALKNERELFRKDFSFVLRSILLVEFSSILFLITYLYVRGFHAQIIDTERFMDLHLYISSAKTDHFPFFDGWNSREDVNYYYYGFFLFSFINKLIANLVPYTMGYHFSFAIVFLNCFLIPFLLIRRISKSTPFAFIGATLLTFGGNLHYASCVLNASGQTGANLDTISGACSHSSASRIILNPSVVSDALTINEFPAYSFVVGDLHPHVLSISFFLVALTLLFYIFRSKKINFLLYFIFAFLIANLYVINTWDFLTIGLIFAFIIFYKFFKEIKFSWNPRKYIYHIVDKLVDQKEYRYYIFFSIISLIAPFIFFSPFHLHYKNPTEGIGFAPSYISFVSQLNGKSFEQFQYPSTFQFLFNIWGIYFFFGIILLVLVGVMKLYKIKFYSQSFFYLLFLFLVSTFLIIFTELFFIKELFHVANPSYFRANTVFKLGYHASMLYPIFFASIGGIIYNMTTVHKRSLVYVLFNFYFMLLFIVYLIAVLTYSVFALKQQFDPYLPYKTGKDNIFNSVVPIKSIVKNPKELVVVKQPCDPENPSGLKDPYNQVEWTLDGSFYICARSVGDLEAINWINKNLDERVVIAEAVGNAYTYFGRIGVNTGMGNPFNWPSHQWTWRFEYPKEYDDYRLILNAIAEGKQVYTGNEEHFAIQNDIKLLYETKEKETAIELINKYKISFVYLGKEERETYIVQPEKLQEIASSLEGGEEKNIIKFNNSTLYRVR